MPSIAVFEKRPPRGCKLRIVVIVVASAILVLVAGRLILPWLGLGMVNKRLGQLDGYAARIDAAELRILRGGFTLRDAVLRRDDGADGMIRVEAEAIDVSFSWIRLACGELSGEIVVTRPVVFYAAGRATGKPREGAVNWREVLASWPRFQVSRLDIQDGSARLEWPAGAGTQAFVFEEVRVKATGLGNGTPEHGAPRAAAVLAARLDGGGVLSAEVSGVPLASPPAVDAWGRVDGLELTRLNPLLLATAGVDLSAGKLELEAGFRAAEGYYEGWVRPFVRDAKFTRTGGGTSLGQRVKEAALDAAATVLANDETKRVASEVPFSGKFGEGEVEAWTAFVTLVGNAVGEALPMGRADGE